MSKGYERPTMTKIEMKNCSPSGKCKLKLQLDSTSYLPVRIAIIKKIKDTNSNMEISMAVKEEATWPVFKNLRQNYYILLQYKCYTSKELYGRDLCTVCMTTAFITSR